MSGMVYYGCHILVGGRFGSGVNVEGRGILSEIVFGAFTPPVF